MSYNFPEEKPLLTYSDTLERATLVDYDDNEDEESMPPRAGRRRRRKTSGGRRRRGAKVRLTHGKINLKIKGYSGSTSFSAGQLLPYIPLAKLKVAARKVLKRTVGGRKRRRTIRRRKRKSRK